MIVSEHAVDKYLETNPHLKDGEFKTSREKLKEEIESLWHLGREENPSSIVSKLKKYGAASLEYTEHRKALGYILTKVKNKIVTIHKLSSTDKRKHKRKRNKANKKNNRNLEELK